jgi:hypothetical protein
MKPFVRFDNNARRGEEPAFTDGFSAPMVQLPAASTVLAIAHSTNTFSKEKLQLQAIPHRLKDVIDCKSSLRFYRYQLPKLLGARREA